MLRRTAELATFLDDPTGRVLIGESWLYYCAHPELFGIVLWGRPGGDPIRQLVRALHVELKPGIVPHRSLVDASRLEAADLAAFEVLNQYVVEQAGPLSRAVTRLALVRPDGLVGAMTAGFYEVLERPYPIEIVSTIDAGLTWLGEPLDLGRELDTLVEEVRGSSVLVERLRAWLAIHLRDSELSAAARALAVSPRTLQRRLREAGTTFARQQLETRLSVAMDRMRRTDAPLSTIALEVGFSSQQHFSTAFRKAHGEAPSTWRTRATS